MNNYYKKHRQSLIDRNNYNAGIRYMLSLKDPNQAKLYIQKLKLNWIKKYRPNYYRRNHNEKTK